MKTDSRILQEILALAKTELEENQNPDMGYTTPDGNYHIFIYKDQEHSWEDGPAPYSFYVVEPNKVVSGAHEPLGDTFLTERLDLSELLVGCQWCLEQFEADRERSMTTKDRAMALYEESRLAFNKDNDAFYIARDLSFLAHNTEPNEEIPLEKLYRLAERLTDCSGCFVQPLLGDERAAAVQTLLENGMRKEYDACLGDLTPEQTLDFLLTCDNDAFAYAVEATGGSNQEKYAVEIFNDDYGLSAFQTAFKAFRSNLAKPSLDQQILDAAPRAGQKSEGHAKSQTIEK